MPINVTRSSMPSFEEYCDEIKELWDTHWLTNMGVKHKKLQSELEEYLDVPFVALYTNGHLALEGILEAMNFPRGSEVITTPFTFVSTTHAIARCGLVPVFCDITEENYTMDPSKIEALITEKTVAIMPVHVYGNICDVEAIDKIAKKHNLKVIYDAAHAFGIKYKEKSVANFGDASMFSFHATKVFNTIEGGAVCYKDEGLKETLADLKNFGILGPDVRYIGGNAKMSEFQAAMGICNLRHIEEEIEKRRLVDLEYRKRLCGTKGIKLCEIPTEVKHNYSYFPVVFEGYKYTRDEVFDKLAKEDIIARKYFFPATNCLDCYSGFPSAGGEKTPVSTRISEEVLTLPMYADLPLEIVNKVCDIILG